jgi:hypothetical protein
VYSGKPRTTWSCLPSEASSAATEPAVFKEHAVSADDGAFDGVDSWNVPQIP